MSFITSIHSAGTQPQIVLLLYKHDHDKRSPTQSSSTSVHPVTIFSENTALQKAGHRRCTALKTGFWCVLESFRNQNVKALKWMHSSKQKTQEMKSIHYHSGERDSYEMVLGGPIMPFRPKQQPTESISSRKASDVYRISGFTLSSLDVFVIDEICV